MLGTSPSQVTLLRRLWRHIGYQRRVQLLMVFVLMLVASVAEVVSIGAVLPFLGLLASPEGVYSHPWGQKISQLLGVQTPQELLFPMTVLFAMAAVFSGAMRFLLLWAQTRLAHAIGSDFSLDMYRRTLHQPYAVHVSRNSSEIISGISNKAKAIVDSAILPLMTIFSAVILLSAILITMLSIQPFVTLVTFSGFGTVYALLILLTKRRLLNNSHRISEGHTELIKLLQEGLGGIRDVLIDGTQAVHCRIYEAVDTPLRRAVANVQIISVSPRYGVEALGMVLIALVAYLLIDKLNGSSGAIPVLGALAMGALRMLPALQQGYSSWASIRGGQISLGDAMDLMDQPLPECMEDSVKMRFERSILLRGVSFKFQSKSPEILTGLDIDLAKGRRIGIVGNTGSGKSTFLDVVMGLLPPTQGQILVDGVAITDKTRRAWQKHIAHVPQTIFLSDASISENIALGVPKDEIDLARVHFAAQRAQIAEFIEAMDQKYQTLVGERGVKLSGGQRQRIGIARALYKDADVLVLDEATSALDNDTESRVMHAIDAMGSELTIIIVAHRLSTLRNCDQVLELEAGKLKRVGTYADIVGA